MKKLALCVLLISSLALAFADDGGSYRPEDWTYGNIYVKEPNQKIALENEILYFTEYDAAAVFDFNNTVKEKVTVPCSFPVVIEISGMIKDDKIIPEYNDRILVNKALWEIVMNRKLDDEFREGILLSEIKAKDKSLRVLNYDDYLKELKSYGVLESKNQSGIYGNNILSYYSGCDIRQDGKNIQIKNTGVEVTFLDDPQQPDKQKIRLVLHFYHELNFHPSAHSTVKVSYKVTSVKTYSHSYETKAVYDISTGGTWKGSMKNFIVHTGMNLQVMNGKSKYESVSQSETGDFHIFRNYKPSSNEYFVFSKSESVDDRPVHPLFESNFRELPFVSDIKSSSYLKGTFKYPSMKDYYDFIDGNEKTSDYSPATSFDRDPYNGWVEGVKGNGKGEWIGFTLSKWAVGPFATNGLTRYHCSYGNGPEPCSTWLENNRIRSMNLMSSKGKVCTLNFRDEYSGFQIFPDGRGYVKPEANSVVNPRVLKPDTYKLVIEDVYKGSKYDDTVLGEVWFIELPQALVDILMQDEKSPNPILRDYLQDFFYMETNQIVEYYMDQEIYHKEDD